VANAIITLTTDYGTDDHLVGTVKGVILRINPEVTIVDITHHVTPFDLLDGALAIGAAYAYFPPKTIHVVIVDPGVGTERRPLLVSGQNHLSSTNAKQTWSCATPLRNTIFSSR
jgi:S-adenosylmethionine hydrolase